ncbi:MAG: hypothetical protein ABS43_27990 [Bordetella sp. SCN 67-23]|nr:hypothetical protein [Burkholderiales bacterium]ODS68562.1 MAG: hypothetical protein ABS43_27990 [Bordetella sp. SCN 67-23]ODU72504.1 MAG: hypothetical protein ABT00_17655 [Bordetella sp. SCN 68-11]OJW90039.1 MAG: hypothetical protein BGO71_27370 [Burkholderiales bacterium 67-32]
MKYVQDSKLTDTLERELIRGELANELEQPRPFETLRAAATQVLNLFADLKANARRYNVQYVNG